MGAFTRAVQTELRETLADERPRYAWHEEYVVEGTPVDVAGVDDGPLALVEVEMRRADPANNTVKLFRAVEGGALDAFDRIAVVQAFSGYYDLASGGVSTKRENAEFVGDLAARAVDRVTYDAVTLDLVPPKRGADPPEGWEPVVRETARAVADRLP